VESFNGRLRDECLNETLFTSLPHARAVLTKWQADYNHVRPHSAHRGATPAEIGRRIIAPQVAEVVANAAPEAANSHPGLWLSPGPNRLDQHGGVGAQVGWVVAPLPSPPRPGEEVLVHAKPHHRDGHGAWAAVSRATTRRNRVGGAGSTDGGKLTSAAAYQNFVIDILRRLPDRKGLRVLPRCWVMERAFGWITRWRRLVRAYKRRLDISRDMIRISMGALLLKHVAHP